jgi:hypothetical protein
MIAIVPPRIRWARRGSETLRHIIIGNGTLKWVSLAQRGRVIGTGRPGMGTLAALRRVGHGRGHRAEERGDYGGRLRGASLRISGLLSDRAQGSDGAVCLWGVVLPRPRATARLEGPRVALRAEGDADWTAISEIIGETLPDLLTKAEAPERSEAMIIPRIPVHGPC